MAPRKSTPPPNSAKRQRTAATAGAEPSGKGGSLQQAFLTTAASQASKDDDDAAEKTPVAAVATGGDVNVPSGSLRFPEIPESWTTASSADDLFNTIVTDMQGKSDSDVNKMMLSFQETMPTPPPVRSEQSSAEEDAELKMYQAGGKDGVETRSKLGTRFMRDENGGSSRAYKDLKSNAERAAFRQAWSEKKYNNLLEKKKHIKSYEVSDEVHGEYMSLNQIYVDEGGSNGPNIPTVVQAVQKYVAKCLVMQGTWVQWDGMSEQMNFLRIKQKYKEKMREGWSLCQTSWNGGAGAQVGTPGPQSDVQPSQTTEKNTEKNTETTEKNTEKPGEAAAATSRKGSNNTPKGSGKPPPKKRPCHSARCRECQEGRLC